VGFCGFAYCFSWFGGTVLVCFVCVLIISFGWFDIVACFFWYLLVVVVLYVIVDV